MINHDSCLSHNGDLVIAVRAEKFENLLFFQVQIITKNIVQ